MLFLLPRYPLLHITNAQRPFPSFIPRVGDFGRVHPLDVLVIFCHPLD